MDKNNLLGDCTMFRHSLAAVAATFMLVASPAAQAQDVAAAEATLKKSGCLKCHAVDRKKDGPSFKESGASFKAKPDGEKLLFTKLSTTTKIKVDGKEEDHDPLKTKNEAEIKNVVTYILTR
jgi:cytochrome c